MRRSIRASGATARLAVALLALAATGAAHRGMDTRSDAGRGERFVPRPEQARLSTLGFDALAADAYWLQAIQILGSQAAGIGEHGPLVGRLVDVVTTLDPWVGHPYRFAAVWLTDGRESVLRANRLLERGIAYHPRDWRNRHYLGFNYFFFLGDDERAAAALEGAVGLPGAPPYLAGLVAKLRSGLGGLDTAQHFLAELAATSEDPYARAGYEKALDEVETERRARFLDAARAEYRRRSGRDIERVVDLLRGPHRVLRALPPAHPVLPGFEWILDPETGRIVSSFYRARYEPRIQAADRERRRRWGGAEG